MLFRLREIVRNLLIRFFMAPRNNLQACADRSFSPDGYDQTYIVNSTIITKYQKGEDVRFFRECHRHLSLRDCLIAGIEDYFDRISCCAQRRELKEAIFVDIQDMRNYRRITKISGIFESDLMDILKGVYKDYNASGVPCFANFNQQEEFIAFIKYINGLINCQKINAYLPVGMYENYSANKQLATYRLACMLGVESLITPVQVCSFSDGNTERLGTLMEKAPGYPPSEIVPQKRTNLDCSSFLKDLTCLEYLDALCYQLDHRLDNYYVIENKEGQIARVVAFDNDAARTFFINNKLPKGTYAGCSGVLAKDGTVDRPYMDQDFAQALCRLNKAVLEEQLGGLMSKTQLHCLWNRICLLQQAVEKTANGNKDFLVTDWNAVNPQEAADDRYGCTYYKLYLTDTLMLDREKLFKEMKDQQ